MSTRLPIVLGLAVVVTAVASGPLVAGVDLTETTEVAPSGSAELSIELVPTDQLRLEQAPFGAGRYHVAGPAAVGTVEAVSGDPVLRYSIDIAELEFTVTTHYELSGKSGDTVRFRHSPTGVSPTYVDEKRYEATVAVWIQAGDVFEKQFEERTVLEVVE